MAAAVWVFALLHTDKRSVMYWSQPLLWRLRPFLFLLTTSGVSVSILEYSLSPASCP